MEAPSFTARGLPLARLSPAVALAASVPLALVATLLLVRRLAGGFTASLPTAAFLTVGVLLLLVVSLCRLAAAWRSESPGQSPWQLVVLVLPGLALLTILLALSSSSMNVWPLALVWLGVAVEEGGWWTLFFRQRRARGGTPEVREIPNAMPERFDSLEHEPEEAPAAMTFVDAELLPENLWQQITRVRTENGGEGISGILRADFAVGERNQNLHVAFCPPLASIPEFAFEQVDGPAATIKAGQVETFGARLELRLDAAAKKPTKVLMEFSAVEQVPEKLS